MVIGSFSHPSPLLSLLFCRSVKFRVADLGGLCLLIALVQEINFELM